MIDKSKAMRDFQLTEEQYDDLLKDFAAQAAESVRSLESAVRDGRMKDAADAAHSLKGVAGNLRLDDCYTLARNIESALKGNDLVTVNRIILDFKKSLQEIRAALKKT